MSRQVSERKEPAPAARLVALILAAALAGGVVVAPGPQAAHAATSGSIRGQVVDRASGAPIAAAQVTAPDLGLAAATDSMGRFAWSGIPVPPEGRPATVEVRSPGYGAWTLRDVVVLPDDTLILEIELGPDPVEVQVPAPRAETPSWSQTESPFARQAVQGAAADQMSVPLPATIRVRVTGYPYCDTSRPYTVRVVDFKEYIKNVLPNEWVASWPHESLRAGAMAAKMYAWQIVTSGGKWPDADVYDSTCDQVYIPGVSYASTNRAVDFTWNWRLTKDGLLVLGSYRAWYSQCVAAGKAGRCIGQWDTYYHALGNNGYAKLTWDEMLYRYYVGSRLTPIWDPPGGFSLRYYGNGWGDIDRVKIALDQPARPVDVGAGDFTVEWWMKASASDNPAPAVRCGAGDGWVTGNVIFDRDVFGPGDYGDFGISLGSGRLAFGAAVGGTASTVCGGSVAADGAWHHVAVTRRAADGRLQIFLDGRLDGEGFGPTGDMSYADGRATSSTNDPYLVLGAQKHDTGSAYNGFLDELRISNSLRYGGNFTPPTGPFSTDSSTVALYHFNEGLGNTINDVSGASGGPSQGLRRYGGFTNGPEWTDDSPWFVPQPTPTPYFTPTRTPTVTRTPTASATASASPSSTPGSSPTALPTASSTASATASATTAPSATATTTSIPSATNTASPSAAPSSTPTWTLTAAPTATASATPPAPTSTSTPGGPPLLGDLSLDGRVDILDVQLCVNVVLGTEADPGILRRADVNGDSAVNVLDIQMLVNIILGQ